MDENQYADGVGDGKIDLKDAERIGKKVSRFMREHNVLTRGVIAMFLYIFWDMNWWLQRMVEESKIDGEVIVTGYVVAMAGGFVAVINALVRSELSKDKEGE